MSDLAVKVENLSKRYRIGERTPYKTLRETLANSFKKTLSRPDISGQSESSADILWALKEISFQIKQGEVIGVIGRNGAGKSTLLKIISKITEPTKGRIEIRGRVGSLLEIGTGFHPELTGHENIYLYGAILGMARREINRKFDEIVAFAEMEKFMQTPVKRYSSGMFMRLAFAVAAHLEPDILLVDEVLAVGDTAFQKKCLGKMEHVASAGRTILFVSHNMGAVTQLCRRTLLLDSGRLATEGATRKVIEKYLYEPTEDTDGAEARWNRQGSGKVFVTSIRLLNEKDEPTKTFFMGQDLKILVAGKSHDPDLKFNFSIQVVSDLSIPILFLYDQYRIFQTSCRGSFRIQAVLSGLRLMPGRYFLHIWLGREGMEEYDSVKNITAFEVIQSETALTTHPLGQQYGFINEPFAVKQLE